jgi:hypothetical protein
LTERTAALKGVVLAGAAENPPHETANETKGMTQREGEQAWAFNIRKQIGSTAYDVEVYFSPSSRETLGDKILRLARGEILNGLNEPDGDGGQR